MAVGKKVQHFEGKGTDLGRLADGIESYLQSEKFTTQRTAPSEQGAVIQAKKGGFLAGIVDADRALTISISGSPDDFDVTTGIGKWAEHLGVAAIETLLVSELFLVVDVAEMAWNVEIEDKLAGQITALVG